MWPAAVLRRIFIPPTLVARQFASTLFFRHLIGWRHYSRWLCRHSFKSLPVAAGAVGMGCIGFPAHPVWEVTAACNLSCIHCHASSGRPDPDELSTEESKRLIDQLAGCDEFRMLVYTGGEPLCRSDIFELLEHSARRGFINVIASNGTLITAEVARRLKAAGVYGVAISLDSADPRIHNHIRTSDKAFELALRGIENVRRSGMLLQINITAMEYNFETLGQLLEIAEGCRSGIVLMYQLVPVGRGQVIGEASLTVNQNEKLLKFLAEKQKKVSVLIEPVAGPQYWPYLMEHRGKQSRFWRRLAAPVFHGCAAGRGFVYIKANGDVWPCPFIEASAGSIRQADFKKIWVEADIFRKLRQRESLLQGKCGRCDYRKICGGCRGRALTLKGDLMAEDPSCFIDVAEAAAGR